MLFREWSEADFPKLEPKYKVVYHVTMLFREWSEADFPKLEPKYKVV